MALLKMGKTLSAKIQTSESKQELTRGKIASYLSELTVWNWPF